jgi:hypothetical protein
MRQKLTVLLACACPFVALAGAASLRADPGPDPEPEPPLAEEAAPRLISASAARRIIERHRREVWHWQRVMGRRLTRDLRNAPAEPEERIAAWRRFAVGMRRRAHKPPHKRAWLCIHRYEAAWNDSSAPYYGGLQMDLPFQRRYGGVVFRLKGTADHWTPLEQMWAAERAQRSGRGFYAWPSTARYCGLL